MPTIISSKPSGAIANHPALSPPARHRSAPPIRPGPSPHPRRRPPCDKLRRKYPLLILNRRPLTLDQPDKQLRRRLTHLERRLPHRRQPGTKKLRRIEIAETRNAHLLRYPVTPPAQQRITSHREPVRSTKQRIGRRGEGHQLRQRLLDLLADHSPMHTVFNISLVDGKTRLLQSIEISLPPLERNGNMRTTCHMRNTPVTGSHQLDRCIIGAASVIRYHPVGLQLIRHPVKKYDRQPLLMQPNEMIQVLRFRRQRNEQSIHRPPRQILHILHLTLIRLLALRNDHEI